MATRHLGPISDDHSRYALVSRSAAGETAQDAVAVFDKAVATYGVPGLLLIDNGLALNPSPTRRRAPRVSPMS